MRGRFGLATVSAAIWSPDTLTVLGFLKSARPRDARCGSFLTPHAEIMRYVIEKGSIAVNGMSLTVNGVSSVGFDVNIVPHTALMTTVGGLQIGSEVNIETDLIGKYVEKLVCSWESRFEKGGVKDNIDFDFLKQHGFAECEQTSQLEEIIRNMLYMANRFANR